MRPLKIFTWHVHGSYLYYLTSRSRHEFYVPSKPGRPVDYVGKWGHIPWTANVHDVPVDQLKNLDFDVILFQRDRQYLADQHEILSDEQRRRPKIFLEHDPPCDHPTGQRHCVDDPTVLLVHCTPFNQLMWDSNRTPTMAIDHGVVVPADVRATYELDRGIVVINHLGRRGRRLGPDVYRQVRQQIPLDLVGMAAEEVEGGLEEVKHAFLPAFEARYRFFFNPIRYTSMGLAVIEAMMLGLPVIGLATTEMATAIENGKSGYVDTNVDTLIGRMKELIAHPEEARRLGEGARRRAYERFNIDRFMADWDRAFSLVTGLAHRPRPVAVGERP